MDTVKIPISAWMPDQPDYGNKGLTVATNCQPVAKGYEKFKALADYSNAGTNYLRGIFACEDTTGSVKIFCGDETKLYLFNNKLRASSIALISCSVTGLNKSLISS